MTKVGARVGWEMSALLGLVFVGSVAAKHMANWRDTVALGALERVGLSLLAASRPAVVPQAVEVA